MEMSATYIARSNGWLRVLLQLFASVVTLWLSYVWLGSTHPTFCILPLTAVQAWIALGDWRHAQARVLQLSACWVGEVIGFSILGIPFGSSAWLASAQVVEVCCVVALLYPHVANLEDLKQRKSVLRLCTAAIVPPMLATALSLKPLSLVTHTSMTQSWLAVAPSDALGIAVVLPVLLLSSRNSRSLRGFRGNLQLAVPALVLFIAVLFFVFSQSSKPLLFFVFPPLILLLFITGLEGATFASLAVTIVAGWETAHGHGPMWLVRAGTEETRVAMLQLFLGAVVVVAIPVGALFDEQQKAVRNAWEGQTIYRLLMENAEDMIVHSKLDGTRRFVSPAVFAITGWMADEFLALGHLGGIHPEDREIVRSTVESLVKGEMRQSLRHRLLCKGGGSRWVETSFRGYRISGSDRVVGYVATVRDISKQIETEEFWSEERAALANYNQQLADLATKDELTGIANRRGFNLALEYEFERHTRSGTALTVVMLDVDHFKKYNDALGHPAGDACLRRLAQAIAGSVRRANDRVARVGGEEFAVILPETDEAGASRVATAFLDSVALLEMKHPGSPLGRVSISIGVATMRPHVGAKVGALIQRADQALYRSKHAGRNRITVSWSDHCLIGEGVSVDGA